MKKALSTSAAPAALGPYSQGIDASGLVFTSGQLPIGPNGALETADIAKATGYCLQNVRAVLEAAGLGLQNVVKTTVFLTDLNDFAAMNEAYAAYFPDTPPARSCVQVAALPKGATVEIETIAAR
jgi:2-iminobutanoate/2-iminopropanoate deaminase